MKNIYKIVLAIVCVVVIALAIFGVRLHLGMSVMSTAPAQTDVLQTVYPLYSTGISWGTEESVTLPPRSDYNPATSTIVGYEVSSLPSSVTSDIASITAPLRNQYDKQLLAAGWHIDPQFEADGPGGSVWGYSKGKDILIFSYTSNFLNQQPNTPEQCPCTVTFTIIGGTLR